MKCRQLILILGVFGTSLAQKAPKHRPGHKQEGLGHQGDPYGNNPYNAGHHGGGGGSYHSQPATAAKPTYPLLLSDSRTLNNDGTINFQYAADNGLQQGESVDADGTRRGFYSYPGADGKQITVKYTAGKNGFIAEGDHLPKQPTVPGHSDKDDGAYNPAHPEGGHGHGPIGGARPHQPQPYQPHQGNHAAPQFPAYQGQEKYQLAQQPSQPNHHGGPPRFGGVPGSYQLPAPQHSSPEGGQYQGLSPAGFFGRGQGFDFGPVNYGAPSQSSNKYKLPNAPPKGVPQGGHNLGDGFPGLSQAPAGPFNGQFDLGNGGQFSIDFNPGQSREIPIGGDYSNPL